LKERKKEKKRRRVPVLRCREKVMSYT